MIYVDKFYSLPNDFFRGRFTKSIAMLILLSVFAAENICKQVVNHIVRI